MTPILFATDTYNYALAKWLDEKLKPLSVNEYTISDVFQFFEEIPQFQISDNNFMVSYDDTAVFTNVPLDETKFWQRNPSPGTGSTVHTTLTSMKVTNRITYNCH